jgi:hypothetical protein
VFVSICEFVFVFASVCECFVSVCEFLFVSACEYVFVCVFAVCSYKGGDAASAGSGLEVALQLLLDGAGGVEALSQQHDGVHKEE